MLKLLKISSRAINKETTPLHDCRAHCAIQPKFNQTLMKTSFEKSQFPIMSYKYEFLRFQNGCFFKAGNTLDCNGLRMGTQSGWNAELSKVKLQKRKDAKSISRSHSCFGFCLLVSQSVVLVWIGSDFCLTLICHRQNRLLFP